MNNDQVKGKAEQLKGKFKEAFGKLTDNDILLYEGKRDQFVGKVVQLQGIAKEEAEKRIKAIEDAYNTSTKAA
ncbi:MAG: CsbD family protein [Pseudomonadota bacterium]|nr:CsbD family protein [Pseudomonadota bacterium]MDE3037931.1 CsbD family protein [Pseudomonadota bacterium]